MSASRGRKNSGGSGLSFYSGKVPAASQGGRKKAARKVVDSSEKKKENECASNLQLKEKRPIPSYCKRDAKEKKEVVVPTKPEVNEARQGTWKARRGMSRRPSLSDQLASIGLGASQITASIKRNAGMEIEQLNLERTDKPLLSTPSKSFKVGRLTCKFPSPVQFYKDRCCYTFHRKWGMGDAPLISPACPLPCQSSLLLLLLLVLLTSVISHSHLPYSSQNPNRSLPAKGDTNGHVFL